MHRSIKYLSLGIISIGAAMLLGTPAYAAEPEVDLTSRVPYISLSKVGSTTPTGTMMPSTGKVTPATVTATFELKVNNASRYDVYVSAEDTSLRAEGASTTIDTMGSGVVAASAEKIPANKWGIRGVVADAEAPNLNTNFEGIPYVDTVLRAKIKAGTATAEEKAAYKTAVEASAKRIGGDEAEVGGTNPGYLTNVKKVVTLQVGAAVDSTLEAGVYTGEVIVSAVATPRALTIFDISTMQDMTPEICAATPTPTRAATESKTTLNDVAGNLTTVNYGAGNEVRSNYVPETTLSDSRAGQTRTYLIRKLADGNCWMAQNLQLDFLGAGQGYATAKTSNATGSNQNDADYTLGTKLTGDFELTWKDTDLPEGTTWTPASTTLPTWATMIGARLHGVTPAMYSYGWKSDGSDGLRSYSYPGTVANCLASAATLGTDVCNHDVNQWGGEVIDGQLKVYGSNPEPHGPYSEYTNLYNWTAATLGSGNGVTNADAPSSICPRGWKLPSNTGEDSFQNLLANNYGLIVDGVTSDTENVAKLRAEPLSFQWTGYYERSYGYLFGTARDGDWWSGTASTAKTAYYLGFYGGLVGASFVGFDNPGSRGYGIAVRCVAKRN